MSKFSVSIVIPSMGSIESSPILLSYLESKSQNLYIQFIFLLNKKFYADDKKNNIQKFNQYEIVTVVNDRYFGSCEENLYRVGDFSDLLYEHVFCVGEHDFIDWALLNSALERFSEQKLGVLAWNIKCRQMTSRGDYAELSAIFPLDFQSTANEYCHMLLSNEVLD